MVSKREKRLRQPDYDELMKRTGGHLFTDAEFRCMLDNIHNKCEVEAEYTHQHGTVCDIIRDRYGIPVAVKVNWEEQRGDGDTVSGVDYIAMADVTFWEPYDHDAPTDNYVDDSSTIEALLASGYVWTEIDGGCYYNAETGDKVVW